MTLAGFIDTVHCGPAGDETEHTEKLSADERSLVEYFGADRPLTDITPGDCDDWKAHQEGKGHAPATIGRNVKRARQFFRAAVRKRLLAENPMQDVKAPGPSEHGRAFYVTREATEKIIAACPDAEWRLIVALARYGGLRTPSETFALTWADVDWEHNRVRIPQPKTECHAGRESRMLPLFPELRPHLEAVFDEAEPGTTYVIAKHRDRQREPADHLGADMRPGGRQVVGAGFSEHAGEPRDGVDPRAPVARCSGLAGQLRSHCGPALSASDRRRL